MLKANIYKYLPMNYIRLLQLGLLHFAPAMGMNCSHHFTLQGTQFTESCKRAVYEAYIALPMNKIEV